MLPREAEAGSGVHPSACAWAAIRHLARGRGRAGCTPAHAAARHAQEIEMAARAGLRVRVRARDESSAGARAESPRRAPRPLNMPIRGGKREFFSVLLQVDVVPEATVKALLQLLRRVGQGASMVRFGESHASFRRGVGGVTRCLRIKLRIKSCASNRTDCLST